MFSLVFRGLLYPFLGTTAGSAFVFFMKNKENTLLMTALDSIAAGIMCAASFFSLISPAVEQAESRLSLLSCSVGFFSGMLLFILTDIFIKKKETTQKNRQHDLLLWAVTLHNIPEGMAVGVVYAGFLTGQTNVSVAGALSLSIGIALQNIPEGAIISMPLSAKGEKRSSAFLKGLISGVAELISGVITLFLSYFIYAVMPFCLCLAAGAMIYVVLAELSSEFSVGKNRSLSLALFSSGFTLMMLLDTFLG